jgi:hypothetical protein
MFRLQPNGFTNHDLRPLIAELRGLKTEAITVGQNGVPPGRWTSKAGSLVGQLRGCSRGDYKKIIHGGVPG